MALLALGGLVAFIFGLIGIVLYLLFAFGLYKLADKEKIEYSWLAFIPIAQMYTLGKLIKEIKIFNFLVPKHELVLPVALLVSMVFSRIPVLGTLVSLAVAVLSVAAFYYLFKRYKGSSAVVMTILSVVLFFMGPIFIFLMRDASPLDAGQTGVEV